MKKKSNSTRSKWLQPVEQPSLKCGLRFKTMISFGGIMYKRICMCIQFGCRVKKINADAAQRVVHY